MNLLITPAEVCSLAFASSPGVRPDAITEPTILSAQEKFIRPVLGPLYESVENGRAAQLLNDYIKPALAYYVKLLILPSIAVSAGSLGLIQQKGGNFTPATAENIAPLRRRTRSEATALIRRAVNHIEASPTLYPEYDPAQNILNRISINSQIVL